MESETEKPKASNPFSVSKYLNTQTLIILAIGIGVGYWLARRNAKPQIVQVPVPVLPAQNKAMTGLAGGFEHFSGGNAPAPGCSTAQVDLPSNEFAFYG